VLTVSRQQFNSNYKGNEKAGLMTEDHFFNVFIPKKINGNDLLLVRLNSEYLRITPGNSLARSIELYSFYTPVGVQMVNRSEKWKLTMVAIPKISSDLENDLSRDMQLGGYLILGRVFNEKLMVRAGIYYNRECFGNFWMPLAGVDWKISSRWQMYGIMPSNFRLQYQAGKSWFTGLGFRAFQRSYRLGGTYGNGFVRIRENQLKLFAERFIYKKILVSVDVYRTLGYHLTFNSYKRNQDNTEQKALAPFENNFGFTISLAYRIMTDGTGKK
jgi:hypothetical protein